MAKFDYTLPSGDTYTVVGPADATQAQADQIFYTQVAAGALVGYQPGQTLSGTTIDTRTTSMSRLQRGTAGVASQPVLAVQTRADILSSVLTSMSADPSGRLPATIRDLIAQAESAANGAGMTDYLNESGISDAVASSNTTAPPIDSATITSILQHLPIVAAMPPLGTVPIQNQITQADVMQARGTGLGPSAVGPLSAFQVQSIQAQTANLVNQPHDQISQSKGIGKFGFTCYQLEKVGYVKPTTQSRFIDPDPAQFESVMRSPTIWTGRGDINSVDQILGDEQLQNQIQQELMQCGYAGLEASGVIAQTPQSAQKMRGYIYTDTGLTSNGLQALTDSGLIGGQPTAVGALLTDYQTSRTLSNRLNLKNYYYNQTKTALTSRATNDVGGLVANAAKFGPETTSVWATAGGSNNFTRMMLAGQSSVAATTTQLNTFSGVAKIGALGTATNPVVSASLSSPVSGLAGSQGLSGIPTGVSDSLLNQVTQMSGSMDIMGKAGQFATGFGDIGKNFGDLTSIDKLGDLASSGLDKLSDAASSEIAGLKGLADGALNSVSTGFDKLAKLDLGSIGDVGKLTGLVDKAGLNSLLKNGADLSKLFGGNNALTSGIKAAGGFTETINRDTVDAAMDRIIGSAKINTPTFGPGESGMLGDIKAAKEAISSLPGRATDLLSQAGVTGFNPASLL